MTLLGFVGAATRTLAPLRAQATDIGVLVSVPVVWGTYAPVVRYVYELPVPPPGIVFSAGYYVVAFATLAFAAKGRPMAEAAGLELGGYLFLGNAAQVVGLQSTSADSAAFLIQLTTIIVPALEAWTKGRIAAHTAQACALAFAGVAVICAGDLAPARGDALIVLAALFYSLHVLRLGAFAPRLDALELAVAKAKYETLFSLAAVGLVLPAPDSRAFFDAVRTDGVPVELIVATLWCGVMTCAYTIWAQSRGQRSVPPARANLIYTSQPIFSALFAALLIGEQPTLATVVGGALIIVAVLLELNATDDDDDASSSPLVRRARSRSSTNGSRQEATMF